MPDECKKPEPLIAKNAVCLRKINNGLGENLYLKHRLKGDQKWVDVDANTVENEFIVGLQQNKVYEFVVTSADDDDFDTNIDMSMNGKGI